MRYSIYLAWFVAVLSICILTTWPHSRDSWMESARPNQKSL